MSNTLIEVAALGTLLLGAAAACAPDASDAAAQAGRADSVAPVQYYDSDLTRGLGLPFSEVARVGDLLFLSGMIGTRPGTLELVSGGLEAESRQALENIRLMLEAAGASIRDVVKCTVMLDDMSQWSAFNRIYAGFFGDHKPVRSAFGADGLALGAAVEVECFAAAPRAGDAS